MVWVQALEAAGLWPTVLRAFIGFLAAWALFKVGKKRFLKRGSPFDALIAIMVGAILGRGIAEGEGFIATVAGSALIIATHTALAWLACHNAAISRFIEGHERRLVHDGRLDLKEMGRALITPDDLVQALRLQGGSEDLARIESAWQERSGEISLRLRPDV